MIIILDVLEIVLLIITYSLLTAAIVLELVCYRRNLERPEAIFFTTSLLLLMLALTIAQLINQSDTMRVYHVFRQLTFIAVGLSAPLNVFTERNITIRAAWKKFLIALSIVLLLATLVGSAFQISDYTEYAVVIFLGTAVAGSLLVFQFTSPAEKLKHRIKTERTLTIAFLILVPLTIVIRYAHDDTMLKIGFTIPVVCILFAVAKIADNVERLRLMQSDVASTD